MGDIFEYLNNGGPIVIPILICSIVALTISIERYLSLRTDNIVPKKFQIQCVINNLACKRLPLQR